MNRGIDSDLLLIDRYRRGDRDAFRELVDIHKERVFRTCLHQLHKNRLLAEDATQEVFIKVYRSLPGFRREARFSTWLHTIVKNHCANVRQRENLSRLELTREGTLANVPAAPGRGNEDAGPVDAECVRQKLATLKNKHSQVIEKVHFEGLTLKQAAAALSCPVGTVRSRLNRALRTAAPLLRECMQQAERDDTL